MSKKISVLETLELDVDITQENMGLKSKMKKLDSNTIHLNINSDQKSIHNETEKKDKEKKAKVKKKFKCNLCSKLSSVCANKKNENGPFENQSLVDNHIDKYYMINIPDELTVEETDRHVRALLYQIMMTDEYEQV